MAYTWMGTEQTGSCSHKLQILQGVEGITKKKVYICKPNPLSAVGDYQIKLLWISPSDGCYRGVQVLVIWFGSFKRFLKCPRKCPYIKVLAIQHVSSQGRKQQTRKRSSSIFPYRNSFLLRECHVDACLMDCNVAHRISRYEGESRFHRLEE